MVSARNFANKLWNIARYVEDKVGNKKLGAVEAHTDVDHWLLNKLQHTTTAIADDIESYHFAEAYDRLYHFVWDDFADWYIEASKAAENLPLLAHALQATLTIAHPFAPFVTETIWQTLAWDKDTLLATSTWPIVGDSNKARSSAFEQTKELITEVRAILKNLGLKDAQLEYAPAPALEANAEVVKRMAHLTDLRSTESSNGLHLTQSSIKAWLAIEPNVARRYTDKLEESRKAESETVSRLAARLNNKSYVDNAPQKIVEQTHEQLREAESKLKAIKAEILRYTA